MGRLKTQRISSPGDFKAVFRRGTTVRAAHLRVHVLQREDTEPGRFALVVSKKRGNAVERNRARRRMREAIRRLGGPPPGVDAVFVGGAGVKDLPFSGLLEEMRQVWRCIEV